MPAYGDGVRTLSVIDRWDEGVGWLVHPEEGLARASHAATAARTTWESRRH